MKSIFSICLFCIVFVVNEVESSPPLVDSTWSDYRFLQIQALPRILGKTFLQLANENEAHYPYSYAPQIQLEEAITSPEIRSQYVQGKGLRLFSSHYGKRKISPITSAKQSLSIPTLQWGSILHYGPLTFAHAQYRNTDLAIGIFSRFDETSKFGLGASYTDLSHELEEQDFQINRIFFNIQFNF